MYIVKIGGGASINLEGIVQGLAELDAPFVVVHGANALRDELAARLGLETRVLTSASGYSSVYSDRDAIDLILMAYAGLRNKRIVALCQQHGINAVGLSGIDGRMIEGRRNRGIRIRERGKTLIRRDFSGKPASVNRELLGLLLDRGYAPVLCIPIVDEQHTAINSENDDIVNVLQESLRAQCILQFIEAPGFLDDPEDPRSVVAHLTPAEVAAREKGVSGRMKRKMLALRRLTESAPARVVIADGRVERPVAEALAGKGTVIESRVSGLEVLESSDGFPLPRE